MKKYKILNLYACLGGNRYKWDEVADNLEITAVELDPELARLYQERFPNDTVIVADAHQYLLDHYKEFDFIWSSPPCPTHSRVVISMKAKRKMKYPNMKLYQEIILLDNFFSGIYCVENVVPFYTPLIPAQKRGRHLYWANFTIPINISRDGLRIEKASIPELSRFHEIDISDYNGDQSKTKISRNLVDYQAGKAILETALGVYQKKATKQISLF